jgi:hypothetical protein
MNTPPNKPMNLRPLRVLDAAFWFLDRVGEDLARLLGIRRVS